MKGQVILRQSTQVKQKREPSLRLTREIETGFMGEAGPPWPYWSVGGMFQKQEQAPRDRDRASPLMGACLCFGEQSPGATMCGLGKCS